jgi:hypothetical protein
MSRTTQISHKTLLKASPRSRLKYCCMYVFMNTYTCCYHYLVYISLVTTHISRTVRCVHCYVGSHKKFYLAAVLLLVCGRTAYLVALSFAGCCCCCCSGAFLVRLGVVNLPSQLCGVNGCCSCVWKTCSNSN